MQAFTKRLAGTMWFEEEYNQVASCIIYSLISEISFDKVHKVDIYIYFFKSGWSCT